MAETQTSAIAGHSFNAHLVAGPTPLEANGYLDFYRSSVGHEGYILHLTHPRRGRHYWPMYGASLFVGPRYNIVSAGRLSIADGIRTRQRAAVTSGFISGPRSLAGVADRRQSAQTGFFPSDEARASRISANCSGRSSAPGKGKVAILSYRRSICRSSCCCSMRRR